MILISNVQFELPFWGRLGSAVGKDDVHRKKVNRKAQEEPQADVAANH